MNRIQFEKFRGLFNHWATAGVQIERAMRGEETEHMFMTVLLTMREDILATLEHAISPASKD